MYTIQTRKETYTTKLAVMLKKSVIDFCLTKVECLLVASSTLCNLLLDFSPSKEKILESGTVPRISFYSYVFCFFVGCFRRLMI